VSDFNVLEEMPVKVRKAMQKHPMLKNLFNGNDFLGKFLFYQANTYENGDPWHLVILETDDGITQFGIEEVQKNDSTDLFYYQPISIDELKLYCELSNDFKNSLIALADILKCEPDIHSHDHYHHHSA